MTDTDAITVKTYLHGKFADWRYLIVLDALRYDVFADICQERGWHAPLKLDTRCHCTSWWYRKYWSRQNNDVHLISASPVPFHKDMGWDAWRRFKSAIWADPASETVKGQPDLAAIWPEFQDRGLSIFEPDFALRIFATIKRPGERYLIHLMPPHLPFLGRLQGRPLFARLKLSGNSDRHAYKAIQDYGRAGNWDEVQACYRENIEHALGRVLFSWGLFLDGKTVITSDHGELIGDISPKDGKGVYHHSHDIKLENLWMTQRTVPWFEIRKGCTWRSQ